MQIKGIKKWLVLFNVAISVFMATLDGSIVNIALPVIARELRIDISSVQWVVTSYLLCISVLLLVLGKLSDIYGRKIIFTFGFLLFTFGSILCGFSNNLAMLTGSRIIQAIGASATMALSQGILTSIFPPEERGRALGLNGTAVAIGSLTGPSLGGILVNLYGWKSIFYINVPIGILGTIFSILIIPEDQKNELNKRKEKFDLKGTIMLSGVILFFYLGLLFFQEGKISFVQMIFMIFLSIIILFVFIRINRNKTDSIINFDLFKIKLFSYGVCSGFLVFVALNGVIIIIPFYLQSLLKYEPIKAGIIMSFFPAANAMFSGVSGWLSDKLSYKPMIIAGLTITIISLISMSFFNIDSSNIQIAFSMALFGLGMAIFQSPNNSSIMGSVPRQQLGIAGGINALARNIGMVSGTTFSVILFTSITNININSLSNQIDSTFVNIFINGFRSVIALAVICCVISLALSFVRVKSEFEKKEVRELT